MMTVKDLLFDESLYSSTDTFRLKWSDMPVSERCTLTYRGNESALLLQQIVLNEYMPFFKVGYAYMSNRYCQHRLCFNHEYSQLPAFMHWETMTEQERVQSCNNANQPWDATVLVVTNAKKFVHLCNKTLQVYCARCRENKLVYEKGLILFSRINCALCIAEHTQAITNTQRVNTAREYYADLMASYNKRLLAYCSEFKTVATQLHICDIHANGITQLRSWTGDNKISVSIMLEDMASIKYLLVFEVYDGLDIPKWLLKFSCADFSSNSPYYDMTPLLCCIALELWQEMARSVLIALLGYIDSLMPESQEAAPALNTLKRRLNKHLQNTKHYISCGKYTKFKAEYDIKTGFRITESGE